MIGESFSNPPADSHEPSPLDVVRANRLIALFSIFLHIFPRNSLSVIFVLSVSESFSTIFGGPVSPGSHPYGGPLSLCRITRISYLHLPFLSTAIICASLSRPIPAAHSVAFRSVAFRAFFCFASFYCTPPSGRSLVASIHYRIEFDEFSLNSLNF